MPLTLFPFAPIRLAHYQRRSCRDAVSPGRSNRFRAFTSGIHLPLACYTVELLSFYRCDVEPYALEVEGIDGVVVREVVFRACGVLGECRMLHEPEPHVVELCLCGTLGAVVALVLQEAVYSVGKLSVNGFVYCIVHNGEGF